MVDAGILSEDDRVELIEGEIVEMTPIGDAHAACVDGLGELFVERLRSVAITRVQGPVRLGLRSEPQPDIALLRRRADRYRTGGPGPENVFLLVEVADTTLAEDRQVKIPLYAAAGIAEAWIVDLKAGRLEVYRRPSALGYRDHIQMRRGDVVTIEAFPDIAFTVDEILG